MTHAASEKEGKRIGEILVGMGCVSADEIAEALGVQAALDEPRKLGEILMLRGMIKQSHVDDALAQQRGDGVASAWDVMV